MSALTTTPFGVPSADDLADDILQWYLHHRTAYATFECWLDYDVDREPGERFVLRFDEPLDTKEKYRIGCSRVAFSARPNSAVASAAAQTLCALASAWAKAQLDAACVLAGATRYTDAGITALRIVFRTDDAGAPESWALISRQEDWLTAPTSLDEPVSYGYYDRAADDADGEGGLIESESRDFATLRECLLELGVDGLKDERGYGPATCEGCGNDCDRGDTLCDDCAVTPASRAADAHRQLEAGRDADELTETEQVIDLLTNLRHYCDLKGFDFGALDQMAYRHYTEEKR